MTHARRLLAVHMAEKAKAKALQQASGGMAPAEKTLNKTLLTRAAVTMGLAQQQEHPH